MGYFLKESVKYKALKELVPRTFHGIGIDHLLTMTVYTSGTAKTFYYLTDHLGSVHALADETGNVVESYRFDAWGKVTGIYDANGNHLAESAYGNRFLWQGREYSYRTGFYYFRARWYDPVGGGTATMGMGNRKTVCPIQFPRLHHNCSWVGFLERGYFYEARRLVGKSYRQGHGRGKRAFRGHQEGHQREQAAQAGQG
jgi:uncharacterized protein RhaS with RHS repeats